MRMKKDKDNENIKIKISEEAFEKMLYFTKKVNSEIGGLLKLENDMITDVILLEQEVSNASVNIEARDIAKFVADNESMLHFIKGMWHSHNGMQTFFSSVDENTGNTMASINGYWISIVVNKKSEMVCKLYLTKPFVFEVNCSLEVIKNEIPHPEWDEEIKIKVKERKFEYNTKYRIVNGIVEFPEEKKESLFNDYYYSRFI